MLLDRCMPEFHSREVHSIRVARPPAQLFPVVRHLDFSSSWITKTLFALRGLSTKAMNLDAMVSAPGPFRIIAESDDELVVAGIGRPGGDLVTFETESEFEAMQEPGLIKICWNFSLHQDNENPGSTIVCTETRIQSTDRKARTIFFFYWLFVRPFSGLIRLEMLRIVRQTALADDSR